MSRAPPLWCFIFVLIRAACGQELTPPMFNLAAGRRVFATATCGEGVEEPELYCNLVGMNKHGTEFKEVEEEHLHIQGMVRTFTYLVMILCPVRSNSFNHLNE